MWKQSAIVFHQCQSSDFSTFLAQIKANRWANSLIELVKSKRNWLSALDTSICIYIFIHFPFFAIDRSVVEWVPRTSAWPAFGKLYIDDWAWWRGQILLFYFPPFFPSGDFGLVHLAVRSSISSLLGIFIDPSGVGTPLPICVWHKLCQSLAICWALMGEYGKCRASIIGNCGCSVTCQLHN